MTVVVQLTVPHGWPLHVTWAAMAPLDHWMLRGRDWQRPSE
jgi:hypothetical protein